MTLAGLLMSIGLATTGGQVLDGPSLVGAVQQERKGAAPAMLEHQRFRIELPVKWGKARKVPTFKSPATWRYDAASQTLEVAIGFGQISAENFDKFDAEGLSALPPLQTAFFSVNESKLAQNLNAVNSGGAYNDNIQSYTKGVMSSTYSVGLAAPLGAAGEIAGMPADFKPLMVYRAKIKSKDVREVVDNLRLVIEGEVTSFGPSGSVVCGKYNNGGGVEAHEITGSTVIRMNDTQCFVAAKLQSVSVNGKGGHYLRWGEPFASVAP